MRAKFESCTLEELTLKGVSRIDCVFRREEILMRKLRNSVKNHANLLITPNYTISSHSNHEKDGFKK